MLCVHLMVSVAKLLGPGGTKGLLAETLLLKHQLLVLNRVRRRAPNLTSGDRIFMGFWSLFMKRGRVHKAAAVYSAKTIALDRLAGTYSRHHGSQRSCDQCNV